jgi:hypothetical protein
MTAMSDSELQLEKDLAERVRETLRVDFVHEAETARRRGNAVAVSAFEYLARSVDAVTPELLCAHYELFDDFEVGKIDIGLTESIHRGRWYPAGATEYLRQFIAFASGTEPFRYDDER